MLSAVEVYEVLNKIAVDSDLARGDVYEVDLAVEHLKQTKPGDLLLSDRNYPSYRFIAEMSIVQRDFVIRCSAASFKTAREMLRGEGEDSQIVKLCPPNGTLQEIRKRGLPPQITVRFACAERSRSIRVLLNTGEYEVVVTSLLAESAFLTNEFLVLSAVEVKKIYNLRWQEEGF